MPNLDRNLNPDGTGKYWLILSRVIAAASPCAQREIKDALKVLSDHGALDTGNSDMTEFFVIRLRDKHAQKALEAYQWSVQQDATETGLAELEEYAQAVWELAEKAAAHPAKHQPD